MRLMDDHGLHDTDLGEEEGALGLGLTQGHDQR